MNSLTSFAARFRQRAALNMAFIGMTAVLCFLAWLGSSYLNSRLLHVADYTRQREVMLEQEQALRATSLGLRDELASVRSVLENLQTKFPRIPEESQFLHDLSQRATTAGVSLSEFRPGGVSKQPYCKEIELRLRGTGQYASICRWLDSLSDVPRFVRIANISFAGPSRPGGDCVVDIQIDLLFGLTTQPQIASTVKP